MLMLLALLVAALGLGGFVICARLAEAEAWRKSLVCYRLSLPSDLTTKDVAAWLAQVGAQTIPPRFSLLPTWPVGLEVEATHNGITHTVLVPENREPALLASLRSSLPGVRIEKVDDAEPPAFTAGVELRLTNNHIPLGDSRAATAANGVLAAMQPMPHGAHVRMQWVFAGVRSSAVASSGSDPYRWLATSEPADRDAIRDLRQKQRAPMLAAVGRVVASGDKDHAYASVHRVVAALRVLETPGAHLLWRIVPNWLVQRRVIRRTLPLLAYPTMFNTLEAAGLVAFPLEGAVLPGISHSGSRQLPPSVNMPRSGTVLGMSAYPGTAKPLVVKALDRRMHTYVLGPNGTGKSTLLANMALQDINDGRGCVVLDPKADLVTEVLARFPENRRDDLIILDASDLANPVGFNPLAVGGGEHRRELAAETITHVLKDIYREFWGPRTDDLLRAALLSLVSVPAPNGEPFTLTEVPELLTNGSLRRYVANHPKQHDRWRQYWQEYDQRSPAEQLNMIGPVLNKLRSFTHRTSLRLILGQGRGLDLMDIFTKRKVLLVPLSEGQIGPEAAALIGSLITGALWQATLSRAGIPAEQRHMVGAYLDEFQNIVRIADDVPDMLAQARGLGLSLTLAHQYVKQLPEAVRAAVLGTARTQVFFQLDYEDAQLVAKRVAPALTADDLMHLAKYEIAARLCIDGQTRSPTTGTTLELPAATVDPQRLRERNASRYGTPRASVEANILARARPYTEKRPIRFGEIPEDRAEQ